MKLVSFSVENYRSITSAHRLSVSDMTVLIGPNNEGKSNTLNALATVIGLLRLHAAGRARMYSVHELYDWDRDYPIGLQEKNQKGESKFRVEFHLTPEEITEFRTEIKSNLNGDLPISVIIGKGEPVFKVLKKGPGGQTLSKKASKVAEFIGKRFEFRYIPAIRTTEKSMDVVSDMLADAFREIEKSPEYINAIKALSEIQQPILSDLSIQITAALKQFIPQVNSAKVRISEASRTRALRRSFEIIVDDGTPTSIEQKGDGIKSLAAISLLKGVQQQIKSALIALEEPESHLHPGAIHLLKTIIDDLALHNQVILTTHCPLFVDRVNIGRNILVTMNEAKAAKRIEDIREILGIRASDNLLHASIVLIVEGEDDVIALKAILSTLSDTIRDAIRSNYFVLDAMGGAGNLSYKSSSLQAAICQVHAFLDNDDSGRSAVNTAISDGNILASDYTLTICKDMKDSELEDTYKPDFYRQLILDKYNVDIFDTSFRGNKKWSERMKNGFLSKGIQWDNQICKILKHNIAALVETNPGNALHENKRSSIDALIEKIERMLSTK